MRLASLAVVLFLLWLGLSGHYIPFLIWSGVGCAVFCVIIAVRMGIVDREGHPVHLLPAAVTYVPWLLWEITKSAWAVTKLILDPRLPISPVMTTVKAGQRTNTGVAVYANSITLTPGTITVGVTGNLLTVHAVVRDGALDLEAGGMDARVTRFEGSA